MSQLRSLISELETVDPSGMTPAEIATEIEELALAQQKLEVLTSTYVNELTRRNGHAELGYSSASNLLCDRARVSPGVARRIVSRSQMAARAPHAFRAWADGRISTGQARYLFTAAEQVPDAYPEAEETLVQIVETLDVPDTGRVVEYWRQSVDGPGEIDPEQHQLRRGLHASWTTGNMLRVDGWLSTTAGQAFLAAVEANNPPPSENDTRTPRQRRHDALENLCRDWLDNGTTPHVGGEKPHVVVHTDLPALQGLAGGLHEAETGQVMDVDTIRRIACDASVTRIVLGPAGEVFDVGRKTRVWTTAQRRAIVARDRHCQGPGCHARPQHCDIHHLEHWADGGTTTIETGVLLCRPCHTTIHIDDKHQRRRQRTQG